MKLTVLQENLKRGLATVGRGVAGKSTLPVLACVLLKAEGGRLKLAATNLELGITHWVGAQIDEEGAAAIPHKLLSDVVNSLPNERVVLTLNARTQTLTLVCGRFTTNIKGIEADEFPTIPAVPADATVTLPHELFAGMVKATAFAAATGDGRPVLNGVHLRVVDGALSMAAADGFRLAYYRVPIGEGSSLEAIVPSGPLAEAAHIATVDATPVAVSITPGGNQIGFATTATEMVSRLVDGKFPDVLRLIPTQSTTRAVIDVEAFRKAAKLASYFATESQNVLRLNLKAAEGSEPGAIELVSNAAEVGDSTGDVPAQVAGPATYISLNVVYLRELLDSIKTPTVSLSVNSPTSPAVFAPVGTDGYTHLIMPMSTR